MFTNRNRLIYFKCFFSETHFEPNLKSSYECDFSKKKFCNKLWKTETWHVRSTPLTAAVTDERWEGKFLLSIIRYKRINGDFCVDFPLLLTNEGSFDNELALESDFEVGVSVRASKNVEIRLCQSWNPTDYPCYLINVGEEPNKVFLTKYKPLVKNASVVLGKFEVSSLGTLISTIITSTVSGRFAYYI